MSDFDALQEVLHEIISYDWDVPDTHMPVECLYWHLPNTNYPYNGADQEFHVLARCVDGEKRWFSRVVSFIDPGNFYQPPYTEMDLYWGGNQ